MRRSSGRARSSKHGAPSSAVRRGGNRARSLTLDFALAAASPSSRTLVVVTNTHEPTQILSIPCVRPPPARDLRDLLVHVVHPRSSGYRVAPAVVSNAIRCVLCSPAPLSASLLWLRLRLSRLQERNCSCLCVRQWMLLCLVVVVVLRVSSSFVGPLGRAQTAVACSWPGAARVSIALLAVSSRLLSLPPLLTEVVAPFDASAKRRPVVSGAARAAPCAFSWGQADADRQSKEATLNGRRAHSCTLRPVISVHGICAFIRRIAARMIPASIRTSCTRRHRARSRLCACPRGEGTRRDSCSPTQSETSLRVRYEGEMQPPL